MGTVEKEESSSESSPAVFVAEVFDKGKLAIENNNVPMFEEAVKNIKVNMQDPDDGNTLLHWCACYNRLNFAQQLIEKGAREMLNTAGSAPVEIALKIYNQGDTSYFEIKNLLGLQTRKQLGLDPK